MRTKRSGPLKWWASASNPPLSRAVRMHSDAASQGGGWWAVARLT